MKKKFKKRPPKKLGSKKKSAKTSKQVDRFWGLATRLEYTRIKGKNRKKPGKKNGVNSDF